MKIHSNTFGIQVIVTFTVTYWQLDVFVPRVPFVLFVTYSKQDVNKKLAEEMTEIKNSLNFMSEETSTEAPKNPHGPDGGDPSAKNTPQTKGAED